MQIPKGKRIAALMRHAEREIILPGEFGQDVNLTPAGVSLSEALAVNFGSRLKKIYTSPVKRCVQTAHSIAKCATIPTIIPSHFLGAPGIFVVDEASASPYFLNAPIIDITKRLLSSDENPSGFCVSTSEAVTKLINFMLNHSDKPGINLFITHDAILSVLLGYFFPEIEIEILWPDYLEILFLYKERENLHIFYRSLYKIV
jgi:hypothetical protein